MEEKIVVVVERDEKDIEKDVGISWMTLVEAVLGYGVWRHGDNEVDVEARIPVKTFGGNCKLQQVLVLPR